VSVHPSVSLIACLLILISTALPAQTGSDTIVSDVDWSEGVLRVTVERPIDDVNDGGPTGVSRTQRSIMRDKSGIIVPLLAALRFDSRSTVSELLSGDESRIAAVEEAADAAVAVDSAATPDLLAARVTFELDLYRDFAARFISHAHPTPVEQRLGWVPQTDYTGILIYAADELPLFGTDRRVRVEPAIFPGFYSLGEADGLLYRLAELEHMNPTRLADEGPVAYTHDVQGTGVAERLGPRPLRVLAVGVFGTRPTDVIVSESDALQIIASKHNRALLTDGRIVIVLDPSRL
jgi:hypothetical protein